MTLTMKKFTSGIALVLAMLFLTIIPVQAMDSDSKEMMEKKEDKMMMHKDGDMDHDKMMKKDGMMMEEEDEMKMKDKMKKKDMEEKKMMKKDRM